MGIESGVVMAIESDSTDADQMGAASTVAASVLPAPAPDSAQEFSEWVEPHWRGMAILARRLAPLPDWEDVLQESLSAAWRKRRQYVPLRGSARNWLLSITADQAAKHRRKRVPEPVADIQDSAIGLDNATEIDLERAIARLTRRQQVAIILYYFLGLPIADIAAVMDCSEGTVKSNLRDVRAKLHSILGEDYR